MGMPFMESKLSELIGLKEVLQGLQVLTSYGKAVKEELRPFLPEEGDRITKALDNLAFFKEALDSRLELQLLLKNNLSQFKDIRGTLKRLEGGEALNIIEFFEIKAQLMEMSELQSIIQNSRLKQMEALKLLSIEEVIKLLDPEGTGLKTFYLYDSYDENLKVIRKEKKDLEEEITKEKNRIKEIISQETQLKPKLNGEIIVDKQDKDKIRRLMESPWVFLSSESFRSLVFRVKSSSLLDELNSKLLLVKSIEEDYEQEVRQRLTQQLKIYGEAIHQNIKVVGELDFLFGKYLLNKRIDGVRPKLVEGPYLQIEGGRHPIVERTLRSKNQDFTPIDITLKSGVTLITGANMGGKTVILKLIALTTIMAQMGLYVPAKRAYIGPVSFIHFSIGDQQSLEAGLSTFGAEIFYLKNTLHRVEEGGLILMDELARGTNPTEGYAISKGIMEFLKDKPTISVITSHFDGLCRVKDINHLQVVGLKMDLIAEDKDKIVKQQQAEGFLEEYMDYRLQPVSNGKAVPKDAIFVAKLLGLKDEIIQEAERAIKPLGEGE
ncbi:lysine 5,6-aminomutase reactivase ATPase KamC [Alkaliphilus serpentinus]|uniref:DNA mismatch repair protein MutS n=1 Tax=Alkaliphilus serpentinus TaxID=1482731 RepID=A0A833HQU1_9FIRM|nr:hypothetical protein [Alkaliphilus serpentinus]KAB3532458.1 hypothetical protein F8153_02145 [Alkaliphilus serpentinus]